MWVDKRPSWAKTVLLGGFALPEIWGRTLFVTGLSSLVTIAYETVPQLRYSLTATPFALIGLPLGIFLGFRNNAAYDRFWEGRKLWGALVNTARTLARQIQTLVVAPAAEAEEARAFRLDFIHFEIAYFHALRHHLRDNKPWDSLSHVLPAEQVEPLRTHDNIPIFMIEEMARKLLVAREKGWVNPLHVNTFEISFTALCDLQGGCERIKLTPIPYSYTVLLHRIVAFFCLLLPFGLCDSIRYATPLVVLAVSYCFFGLDAVGDELEQPFGLDVNDLPLKAICRTIERNLRESLGEQLPPAVQPKKGVLT